MKVTYEFNLGDEDNNDDGDLSVFQLAPKMYTALSELSDYMREWRKGWNEDDAEKMEERISEIIVESNIGDIQ